jgi:hypothetical protein
MAADALATLATGASVLRRLAARAALLGSLALAVALDFERLFFLAIIFPVIVLFFLVFGSMGRWVGIRAGATPVGLALGLILAWSLGVSFPMFAPADLQRARTRSARSPPSRALSPSRRTPPC